MAFMAFICLEEDSFVAPEGALKARVYGNEYPREGKKLTRNEGDP